MKRKNAKNNPNKSKRHKNTVFRVAMLMIMIISIGILIGTISYTLNKLHEQKKIMQSLISYTAFNTSVEITSHTVGLNADTDGLKYGKNTPGGGGTRFLDINTSQDALVEVYLSGEMSKFLSIEDNQFYMHAGEFRRVPVNLDIPNETAYGKYNGRIYVLMFKPDKDVIR